MQALDRGVFQARNIDLRRKVVYKQRKRKTTASCETVSRAFSDKLDENDFIEDSYIMEISSPGLDRPLKKDKDFERNMGKLVEIRTYRPIEKQKEFCGILTAYDSNSVTIDEDGTERVFDKKDTALIRLAIEF